MPEEVPPPAAVPRQLIAFALKRYREEADLTVRDAAERLGCKPSDIAHLESHSRLPDQATVESLFRLYGRAAEDVEPFMEQVRKAGTTTWKGSS